VTFLSNLTLIKNKEVFPYELLFGRKPKLALLQLKPISKVS
jgi:hypothetical protein